MRAALQSQPDQAGRTQSPLTRLDLFPTPAFVFRWAETEPRKPQLVDAVRRHRAESPGVVKTNRRGWHSETDLPAWKEPGVAELVRWAARCVEEASLAMSDAGGDRPRGAWRVSAWANINPPGGHNISHTHAQRNWHWSACYYVDLPDIAREEIGGALVLEERGTGLRVRDNRPSSRESRYIPSEGELVVFPAWLYHRVEPHAGDSDRISIAFNFHHPDLEPSRLWEHRPRWWWRKFPGLLRRIAKLRGTQDWSAGAAPMGYDVMPAGPAGE